MRICFISSYPPDKEGVGVFTRRLVEQLAATGDDTFVLTFHSRRRAPSPSVRSALSANPLRMLALYHTLVSLSPDIVHVQYATPIYRLYSPVLWLLLALYKWKSGSRSKFVVTYHEVKREIDVLRLLGSVYYRLVSRMFDMIFVHTTEARDILVRKCGVPASRVTVVPLGVYPSNVHNSSVDKLRIDLDLGSKNVILYFGYIHVDKGIQYLIHAFKLLLMYRPRSKTDSVLLIAGSVRSRSGLFKFFELLDWVYLLKLRMLIRRFGLRDMTRVVGYVDDASVGSLFECARTVVMPYTKVEQSGVLNLALGAGRPIVASDIGGLRETLRNAGVLVPPRDPGAIAGQIAQLLDDSDYERQVVSRYGAAVADNSVQRALSCHVSAYQKLVSGAESTGNSKELSLAGHAS